MVRLAGGCNQRKIADGRRDLTGYGKSVKKSRRGTPVGACARNVLVAPMGIQKTYYSAYSDTI